MKPARTTAFTLLEIIIVIIIVGVLASLALPRFFRTIEFSRSTEAFSEIQVIRGALERCYLHADGSYVNCQLDTMGDIEDPALSPNAHFSYGIYDQSTTGYRITAARITLDGGDPSSTISVTQTSTVVAKSGTTAFLGIQ